MDRSAMHPGPHRRVVIQRSGNQLPLCFFHDGKPSAWCQSRRGMLTEIWCRYSAVSCYTCDCGCTSHSS